MEAKEKSPGVTGARPPQLTKDPGPQCPTNEKGISPRLGLSFSSEAHNGCDRSLETPSANERNTEISAQLATRKSWPCGLASKSPMVDRA
jgi:hypothetical protein